jgi:hypothetical protein
MQASQSNAPALRFRALARIRWTAARAWDWSMPPTFGTNRASLVLVYNERYIMTKVQPARISFNTSDGQHISSRLEFDPVCRSWKSREPCN